MTELPPWRITIELNLDARLLAILGYITGFLSRYPGMPSSAEPVTPEVAPDDEPPTPPDVERPPRTRGDWMTQDRLALAEKMIADGRQWHTIEAALRALPGLSVPPGDLKRYAKRVGLKKPISDVDSAKLERMRATLAAKRGGQASTPTASAPPPAEPTVVDAPQPLAPESAVLTVPAGVRATVAAPVEPTPPAKPVLTRGDRGKDRHPDAEPILVDLGQVQAWASQRGISVSGWEDLARVNNKRAELGLTRFARKFTRSGR